MSKKPLFEEKLDAFLADKPPSLDTRVLARALAKSAKNDSVDNQQDIVDVERAIHIEKNLDEIGLQAMPAGLQEKLQAISDEPCEQPNQEKVVWFAFASKRPKLSALAASVAVIGLVFGLQFYSSTVSQEPTLAQIQQAEEELKLAFEYLSIAQVKSSNKVKQTLNEHVQDPLHKSVLTPIEYFKEPS